MSYKGQQIYQGVRARESRVIAEWIIFDESVVPRIEINRVSPELDRRNDLRPSSCMKIGSTDHTPEIATGSEGMGPLHSRPDSVSIHPSIFPGHFM